MRMVIASILLGVLLASSAGGCGPSRRAPKETDVSVIPPEALAAFRREQPNAVILRANPMPDGNWRLRISDPRRNKRTYIYTPAGDLVRKGN